MFGKMDVVLNVSYVSIMCNHIINRPYLEACMPTFINLLLMYLFSFVAIDSVMSIVIYFMTYYIGRGDETNYILGLLLVFQIAVLPVYLLISKRTSKKTSFIISAVIWICVMGFSFFIGPDMPSAILYIFGALVGMGTGGIVIMIYSMFPDMPDVDELYSGERREGIYSGLLMFMRKLSSALAIFLISQAIHWSGFIPPKKLRHGCLEAPALTLRRGIRPTLPTVKPLLLKTRSPIELLR